MMLDKKQIQMIFLFKFKMGCKAAETTHINNAFGPGITNKHGSLRVAERVRRLCPVPGREKALKNPLPSLCFFWQGGGRVKLIAGLKETVSIKPKVHLLLSL